MTKVEIRKECKEYAEKYLDRQRDEFKRLGVLGDFQIVPIYHHGPHLRIGYCEGFSADDRGRLYHPPVASYSLVSSLPNGLVEAEAEYADHLTRLCFP